MKRFCSTRYLRRAASRFRRAGGSFVDETAFRADGTITAFFTICAWTAPALRCGNLPSGRDQQQPRRVPTLPPRR